MALTIDTVLEAACKSGALFRHTVTLEHGELPNRRLWMRPDVAALLSRLEAGQTQRVLAALRRFVLGGPFTVVTAECTHHEVENIGDIKELKGAPPPFIELRFKPPKYDLRLFGRFIGNDALVLTTYGMKSFERTKSGKANKRISIPDHRKRCGEVFTSIGLSLDCVPKAIQSSISNARFL